MKKTLCCLAYLFVPSLLNSPVVYERMLPRTDMHYIATVLLTVIGIAWNNKYRLCNFWVVLCGLLLSGALTLIAEASISNPPYIFSLFVVTFYTLPCSLLLSVAYLVTRVRKRLKKRE